MWRRQWALSLARAFLAASLGAILVASAVDAAPWAWMGVRIRDLAEQEMDDIAKRHGIREGFGVVVVEVMEGTPAERAGLKNGDLVVAFDERPVTDTRLLQRLIGGAGAGQDVRLTVLRAEGRKRVNMRDPVLYRIRRAHHLRGRPTERGGTGRARGERRRPRGQRAGGRDARGAARGHGRREPRGAAPADDPAGRQPTVGDAAGAMMRRRGRHDAAPRVP